jgi:hypothetical protein
MLIVLANVEVFDAQNRVKRTLGFRLVERVEGFRTVKVYMNDSLYV